jgi:hypothetical protein
MIDAKLGISNQGEEGSFLPLPPSAFLNVHPFLFIPHMYF